jgi:hypothetical protein
MALTAADLAGITLIAAATLAGAWLGRRFARLRMMSLTCAGAALAAGDGRVEYRRHAQNRGHLATYNEGIDWARADYLMVLSADDLLTPGALRRAADVLDARPEVGLTYGRDIVFETEVPPAPAAPATAGWRVLSYEEFLAQACAHGQTTIQAPTAIVRTALQKQVGGFRAELPHAGDTEIWLRLAFHGAVAVTDAEQAFRRIHRRNMSFEFSPVSRLREQKAAFATHFEQFGRRIPDLARHRARLERTLAETAFWGAAHAFEAGQPEAMREHLEFAVQTWPAIRATPAWSRFRWKRRAGRRLCALLGPLASALRGRRAAQAG